MAASHRTPSRPVLTVTRLRELLDYDPATGMFRWRLSLQGRGAKAGNVAGTRRVDGRRQIKIDQRVYFASRLAFLWMTGEWPLRLIDHADGDKTNNRWANLRPASDAQNAANSRRCNGKVLHKGVSFDRARNQFIARIKVNYRTINLGRFDTSDEAHAAYVRAAVKHFGKFARFA